MKCDLITISLENYILLLGGVLAKIEMKGSKCKIKFELAAPCDNVNRMLLKNTSFVSMRQVINFSFNIFSHILQAFFIERDKHSENSTNS